MCILPRFEVSLLQHLVVLRHGSSKVLTHKSATYGKDCHTLHCPRRQILYEDLKSRWIHAYTTDALTSAGRGERLWLPIWLPAGGCRAPYLFSSETGCLLFEYPCQLSHWGWCWLVDLWVVLCWPVLTNLNHKLWAMAGKSKQAREKLVYVVQE